MQFLGHNFFYLTLFRCVCFIGAPVLFHTNAPVHFCFGAVFNDAPVLFCNTALGVLCFGAVLYAAPTQKSCEASMYYSNKTHRAGEYGVHGV